MWTRKRWGSTTSQYHEETMQYACFCPICDKTWGTIPAGELMRTLRAKPKCACGSSDIFLVRVDSAGRRRHIPVPCSPSELAPA